MTRAAPLLVRVVWLLMFAAGVAWAVYFVATLVFSSPPLPQHATVTIASTRESYGTGDPVETRLIIRGDTDLELVEVAIQVAGPAPSTDVVRALVPSATPPGHVPSAQPMLLAATWDQRDAADRLVSAGRYELRARVFYTSSAGSGYAFAHTNVQIRRP